MDSHLLLYRLECGVIWTNNDRPPMLDTDWTRNVSVFPFFKERTTVPQTEKEAKEEEEEEKSWELMMTSTVSRCNYLNARIPFSPLNQRTKSVDGEGAITFFWMRINGGMYFITRKKEQKKKEQVNLQLCWCRSTLRAPLKINKLLRFPGLRSFYRTDSTNGPKQWTRGGKI